jgi:hypothetical protein
MALNFNVDPYYDDFDGTKNFHRILFKPGVAVQARELTQAQTILQNQITSFADNIFKQNSPVTGGQVTTNFDVKYIKIQTTYNSITVDVEQFQNKLIRNADGTVVARVLTTAVATGTTGEGDPPTLIVVYKTGTHFADNDVIYDSNSNLTCQAMPSAATGSSSIASISQGVFYVLGNFVQVTPQTVILDKYGNTPSKRIGLEITETIYDYANDNSLLDPAVGASNYQAPGADRYVINLQLSSRPIFFGDDALFIELVRVEAGSVYKMVDGSVYATIDDYFAKRDYETNGDYIINDFKFTPKTYADDSSKYTLNVGKGLAYVHGYRAENPAPLNIITNRARTTETQNNEPTFIDYGSYFLVSNVAGTGTTTFPVTTANTVDFHCVANTNINSANAFTYNSTLVATAYIRGLEFQSSPSNALGNTYIFKAHVYDLVNKSISANVISANSTMIELPSVNGKTSSIDHAYDGVNVTIITGTNAGETRTISNYNGTTRKATVSLPWSVTPDSTSVYSLAFDTPNIETMVFTNSDGTYPRVRYASADIDNTGKAGNLATGATQFFNPSTPEMIYPIGNPYVSSIVSPSYTTYQEFKGVTFNVSGSTLSAQLSFTGTYANILKHLGAGGTTLSGDVIEQCYTIIVTDRGSNSGITNGQILPWTISSRAVALNSDGSVATFTTTTSDLTAFTATIIAKAFVSDATNTSYVLRIKNLVTANTTAVSSNASSYVTTVNTNTFVDDSASSKGHVYIKAAGVLPTGQQQSLYLSDVKQIIKIIDTKSSATMPTVAMLTDSSYDVTNRYIFDNGQRDSYYDHAYISLRPGAAKPLGNILVLLDYYQHSGGDGYFSKMSYIDNSGAPEDYRQIPVYISKHGASYALRDCIDFRPARLNAQTAFTYRFSNPASTRLGVLQPADLSTFVCNYSYYLGRKDKLVMTKDKTLQVIEGSPSLNPIAPNEPDGALILANITHKPYTGYLPTELTSGLSDLSIEATQHRRYTMSDIAGLDTRINRIEYYTALNALEQNANSLQISDSYGLNRFKNGIMVDDFSGYSAAETGITDFSASINRRTKTMTAQQLVTNFPLKNLALAYSMNNPSTATISSLNFGRTTDGYTNYFTLPYTTTNMVAQKLASRTVNINPFSVTTAKGLVTLSPNIDNWVDTSYSPSLLITDPNLHIYQSSNTINTLIAGDWQTVSGTTTLLSQAITGSTSYSVNHENHGRFNGPYGRNVGYTEHITATTTTSTYQTVTNQQQTNLMGAYSQIDNTYSMNNGYITDISILPWMRQQEIAVRATGLLYKTQVHGFFDTVGVDNYIRKSNIIELTNVAGVFSENDIVGYYSAGTFVPTGIVVGIYDYPESNSMRLYVAGDGKTTTYNNGIVLSNAFFNSDGVYQTSTAQGTFSSQTHFGGQIKTVINTTSLTLSTLASSTDNDTNYVGKRLYITSGTGQNQSAVIFAYSGTTKVVTLLTPITCSVNDIYSIGDFVTNEEGSFFGIFTIPANTFHTGTRVFRMDNRINGNEGSVTTFAEGTFYAQGLHSNKQNIDFGASPSGAKDTFTQVNTREVVTKSNLNTVTNSVYYTPYDPVAQTFTIDSTNFPNGAFISSVRLFFATKPTTDSAPVTLSIVGTLNGYPNGATLDNSIVTLPAYQINVSDSPQYLDSTTYTEFKFNSPVYVQADTLYSFIIKSTSNEYTLWTAANGDTATASSVKNLASDPYPSSITKITTAPYVGALFLSQNAQTWTADQNQSLMFTIERAKFDTTKTPSIRMIVPKKLPQRTLVENQIDYFSNANNMTNNVGTVSNKDLLVDAFNVSTTDFVPSSTAITYTYAATLQSGAATPEVNINPGKYGTTMYEHIYLNDNSGERILLANSTTSFSLYGYLESADDAVSPVISDAGTSLFAIQYNINNCPLSNGIISVTSGGSGYNASCTSVTISAPTGKNGQQAYATANVVGGVIDLVYITTPGAGYIQTPTISIVDANSTPGTGATAIVAGETSVKGGPAAARYITKKVVLDAGFDSGDLNVYLSAYRPVGTDINVYYKVLSRNDTQAFDDGYWQLMTKTNSSDALYSQTRTDIHEYTFAPGTTGIDQGFVSYLSNNGITYYTFSQFAIKIVLTTTDNTLVPFLSDMRCIALPPNTNTTF